MAGIITNPINIRTVYCPWEDISPHDRVLHWEFERLREKEPHKLGEIISSLSDEEVEDLIYNHAVWARDKQLVDFRDHHTVTQYMAGRGFGKSYTLGVTMKRAVEYYDQKKILVIAQTSKDLSRTIVPAALDKYGPSHPNRPEFIGNKSIIRWPNGAVANMLSAESGEDSPRGDNIDILLGDENAFYDNNEGIIDQALMTCRTGLSKAFFFTTPKATPLINDWVRRGKDPEDDYIRLITGSTFDNKSNLSKTFLDTTVNKYKGTRFERVELYGELILENESALFNFETINRNTLGLESLPKMVEYSIGVDIGLTTKKTASKNHKSDATGIIIAGMDENGICYILRDFTGVYTVEQWTNKVVHLYDKYSRGAPTHISIEKNAGGEELISSALEKARPGFSSRCTFTFSSSNKMLRMMPYSLLAEQNKIKYVNEEDDNLGLLFDELTYYDGQGKSPNRFDAMSQALMCLAPHEVSRTVVHELLI